MNLLNLPEEVLIYIFRKLDLKSNIHLYDTCLHLRNIIRMHNVVVKYRISMSTLATPDSLKSEFFKDLAPHLQELDLCAVPNLTKTVLTQAIKRTMCLKTLNIAYTSITIPDLIDMKSYFPALRNITINFTFGKFKQTKLLPQKILLQCQDVFQQFENVHFVGSRHNLLHGPLPVFVVTNKAILNNLKLTIISCDHGTYYIKEEDKIVRAWKLKSLQVYLSNWKEQDICYGQINDSLFSDLDLNKFEFVVLMRINFCLVNAYVSNAFKGFFSSNFSIKDEYYVTNLLNQRHNGNVAMMFWNKEHYEFNESFFSSLKNDVKSYFLNQISDSCLCGNQTSLDTDWCHILVAHPIPFKPIPEDQCKPAFKKRRIGPPHHSLTSFDEVFKNKQEIQLNFNFSNICKNPIKLSPKADFLQKLTHLSLNGSVVISNDFFKILFQCCDKLFTLNVEPFSGTLCASHISRFITLSKSLKNLRLVDRRINFKMLMESLSKYSLLENIHLFDKATEPVELGNVQELIKTSDSLYSLYIQALMSDAARKKVIRTINKAKVQYNRNYMNIEFYNASEYVGLSYDPFIDVFKLNSIKPI